MIFVTIKDSILHICFALESFLILVYLHSLLLYMLLISKKVYF